MHVRHGLASMRARCAIACSQHIHGVVRVATVSKYTHAAEPCQMAEIGHVTKRDHCAVSCCAHGIYADMAEPCSTLVHDMTLCDLL